MEPVALVSAQQHFHYGVLSNRTRPSAFSRRPRWSRQRHGATRAQIALAWVLNSGTIAIPRARTEAHVRENRAALDIRLTAQDLSDLDRSFPPPRRKEPLSVL